MRPHYLSLQALIVVASVAVTTHVTASKEHPVCRKHGEIVDINESCCQDMGTWAHQMGAIEQWMDQPPKPSLLPIAGSIPTPTFCDLNQLNYDEYVVCECSRSIRMDYIGDTVYVKCDHLTEIVEVQSDYPCLPKACGETDPLEAQILLLPNEYHTPSCKIVNVTGGPIPNWYEQEEKREEKAAQQYGLIVGLAVAGTLVLAVVYMKVAARRSRYRQQAFDDELQEFYQDNSDDSQDSDDLENVELQESHQPTRVVNLGAHGFS